jgi:Bardet-Biedl syndrome 9 protein
LRLAGADYICVQSYDGQLSFFEQESFSFSRFLPNFLIPGPLCYCEQTDSFVTCNAAFELESYKFKVLASAGSEKTGECPLLLQCNPPQGNNIAG